MNVMSFQKELFKLPYQPYSIGDTERGVEIPWTLSCIQRTDKRVLDVGYAFAEERYLKELVGLDVPELYGVDYVLNDSAPSKIIKKKADLREMDCFSEGFFDCILAVIPIPCAIARAVPVGASRRERSFARPFGFVRRNKYRPT